MKLPLSLIAACIALPAAAQSGEVFKCMGANGSIEYRNVGDTKGCKRVENAPVTVVPAAKAAPANRANASIPSATQKARDDDRRSILEGELKSQEELLGALRAEYNNGEPERRGDEKNYQKYLDRTARLKEDIARAEANIGSLKREIGAPAASAASAPR